MKRPKKNKPYANGIHGLSKYKPEYCEQMVEFFSIEPLKAEARTVLDKRGVPKEVSISIANKLPTFERFAESIGIKNHETVTLHWPKKYPDFETAKKRCKFLQRDFIDYLTLNGFWESRYAMYISTHLTGRQVQTSSNVNAKVSGSLTSVQRSISLPAKKAEGAPVG
jgi:hypothetical protein